MKQKLRYIIAVALGLFALLTLFLSSAVIFDFFNIREKEGNYVLFVVWANFISSILYLVAVYGLVKVRKWTAMILTGICHHPFSSIYRVKNIYQQRRYL